MVVFREIRVGHVTVKTALTKSGLPDLDYALNPYIGCEHGCTYCYARLYTGNKEVSRNWGRMVLVKTNIASVLAREVARYKPGVVGLGTITDAYQPVEAVYKLTQKCLVILFSRGFRVSIQTKNPLVLRDLDILIKYKDLVDVGFTITTLDNRIAGFIEPKAPPPMSRVCALSRLSSSGIKTWIFYGPIIPGLNDNTETIERLVKLAEETKSTFYYDPLHIKGFMIENSHPLRQYLPMKTQSWWRTIRDTILHLCDKYNVECRPGFTGDSGVADSERHRC